MNHEETVYCYSFLAMQGTGPRFQVRSFCKRYKRRVNWPDTWIESDKISYISIKMRIWSSKYTKKEKLRKQLSTLSPNIYPNLSKIAVYIITTFHLNDKVSCIDTLLIYNLIKPCMYPTTSDDDDQLHISLLTTYSLIDTFFFITEADKLKWKLSKQQLQLQRCLWLEEQLGQKYYQFLHLDLLQRQRLVVVVESASGGKVCCALVSQLSVSSSNGQ